MLSILIDWLFKYLLLHYSTNAQLSIVMNSNDRVASNKQVIDSQNESAKNYAGIPVFEESMILSLRFSFLEGTLDLS